MPYFVVTSIGTPWLWRLCGTKQRSRSLVGGVKVKASICYWM